MICQFSRPFFSPKFYTTRFLGLKIRTKIRGISWKSSSSAVFDINLKKNVFLPFSRRMSTGHLLKIVYEFFLSEQKDIPVAKALQIDDFNTQSRELFIFMPNG